MTQFSIKTLSADSFRVSKAFVREVYYNFWLNEDFSLKGTLLGFINYSWEDINTDYHLLWHDDQSLYRSYADKELGGVPLQVSDDFDEDAQLFYNFLIFHEMSSKSNNPGIEFRKLIKRKKNILLIYASRFSKSFFPPFHELLKDDFLIKSSEIFYLPWEVHLKVLQETNKKLKEHQQEYAKVIAQIQEKGQIFLSKHQLRRKKNSEKIKSESISLEVREAVWRRDQGKCCRCGSREKLEYDHIIPKSEGGSNTARNVELLCEFHNRSKGAKIGG